MPHAWNDIAFTDAVKAEQEKMGSRESYARFDGDTPLIRAEFGDQEKAFIENQNSFYMATVNSDGWPYMQHRGGARGVLRVLSPKELIFADYSGNRQYVSTGNIGGDNRVSLFLMDYMNKTRMKIFGRATVLGADDPRLAQDPKPERGFLIALDAYEWNCPKFIPDLYPPEVIQDVAAKLGARIRELEAQLNDQSQP